MEIGLVDSMAFFFFVDGGADIGGDFLVGGAVAEQRFQIVIFGAEKAGAELAVGGDADARAVAAERLRDGSDQADFAAAVGEAIFAGGFAALMGDGNERPAGFDAALDFGGSDDQLARPMAVGIERHVFDETHDEIAIAGELGEGFDFTVVDAADEDGVDFDGLEARRLRGVDAGHYFAEGFGARDFFELALVEGIEADIDAIQAGGEESIETIGEEVAVGCDGKIGDAHFFESGDEIFDAFADQRLAAGDADFADAFGDENASKALELVPVEEFVAGHVIFRIGGAAIDAAKIAAIGDGDAQVGDGAAEFIGEGHPLIGFGRVGNGLASGMVEGVQFRFSDSRRFRCS